MSLPNSFLDVKSSIKLNEIIGQFVMHAYICKIA